MTQSSLNFSILYPIFIVPTMHPGHFFNEPLTQEILRIFHLSSVTKIIQLVAAQLTTLWTVITKFRLFDIAVEGDGFEILPVR